MSESVVKIPTALGKHGTKPWRQRARVKVKYEAALFKKAARGSEQRVVVSRAEKEAYRWMLTWGGGAKDESSEDYGATVRQFVESLKTKTERPGEEVQFKLRPKQALILELRESYWEAGRVFKSAVLKTRRYGITMFRLVLALERLLRIPGWVGTIIAKDDKDAKKFGRSMKEYFKQIPDWALEMMDVTVVTFNANSIVLEHGDYRQSVIVILTANSPGGIGRGDTNNLLHPTEPPHYTPRAQEEYFSIQPSLGDFPGNEECHESTAGGHDAMFYPLWDQAHWPEEEEKDSEFVRIFIAAYEHPNFYSPWRTKGKREEFARTVGKVDKYGGELERIYLENYLIPYQMNELLPPGCLGTALDDRSYEAARVRALEQLRHARKLQNDKCRGMLKLRQQEYPFTPEEAFRATGFPFFNAAYVDGWMQKTRGERDDPKLCRIGTFVQVGEDVEWRDDPGGDFVMRQDRVPGYAYCAGVDTAGGKARAEKNKDEPDWPTFVLGEVATGFVACYWRGRVRPRIHARLAFLACVYYGKAPVMPERAITGDAGTFITRFELEWLGPEDDRIYGLELLMKRQRLEVAADGPSFTTELGYRTTPQTKRLLVEEGRDHFEDEVGTPEGRDKRCEVPFEILDEMLYFKEENGKYEAPKGKKDDLVIGWCLLLVARRQCLEDPNLMSIVPPPRDDEAERLERLYNLCLDDGVQGHSRLGRGF